MTKQATRQPLVSAIVPTYNASRYITDCLASIAAQQGGVPTEIIVVDDGSTDDTRDKVRAFGRVRLVKQANAGPSAARNRGISEANGEYIAFLDSDDLWTPEKLAVQMALFRDHPNLGLVFGDCRIFDEKGPRLKSMFSEAELDETFWGDPIMVKDGYAKLFKLNYIPTGAAVVRKDCFEVAGNFDEALRYVEDLDLWLRIALHFPLAYVPSVCELKRQHDENVSNNADAMALGLVDVLNKQKRLFGDEVKRQGIELDEKIAFEFCLIGDRCEREERIREARGWYLKGMRENPSARTVYYWLRSMLLRRSEARR